MQRIYRALGIASAQDVRDLQESTASAHERATALADRLMALAAKVDELVAAQRKSMDDLVQEVRDNIDVDVLADDVAASARDNFDISDCIDVDEIAQDVRDNIDVDALAQEVRDTVDLDDLVDQVKDAMREGEAVDLDKMINNVIEREAPGIIGSHLKHIDWAEEIGISVEVEAAVFSNR